jgi:hypothetical protein
MQSTVQKLEPLTAARNGLRGCFGFGFGIAREVVRDEEDREV